MDIDTKAAAQNKAFLAQLRTIVADIKNDKFGIDGTGTTLSSVVGMVVQNFGEDAYKTAKSAMAVVTGEKDKIVALLEAVLDEQEESATPDGDPNDGSLFSHVLKFARSHDPNFQPGKIIPQIRKTSRPLDLKKAVAVRLLVEIPQSAFPVQYTKAGDVAKRQPHPLKVGDMAYAKLNFDGLVNIVPFSLAGSGWELITDADEGVHYEFI